jgi:glycerophosphoryl diester phosphodiesterase
MTPSRPPEIVAHRGASRERPENTLAAFRRAVELGADGVELDVHRAADGVIVVHHDTAVTDAGGKATPITALTSIELAAYRVRGEPIPQLAEVLEVLGTRTTAYCELKGADTARGTLDLLWHAKCPVAVHAFDHRQIADARRIAPEIPRGVLEVSYPVDMLHALEQVEGRDLWRHWEYVDAALIHAAHAEGARVIAWTVNQPEAMRRLSEWRVDAICTDDVALARRTLHGVT